jgi:hypothetical protein
VEELEPLRALRLSTRKTPINDATSTPNQVNFFRGISGHPPGKSNARAPLRYWCHPPNPISEEDRALAKGDPCRKLIYFVNLNLVTLTTESRCQRPSNCHPTDHEATPEVGKRDLCQRSNACKQLTSTVTIHFLPPILPAHAKSKCHVEWESDKAAAMKLAACGGDRRKSVGCLPHHLHSHMAPFMRPLRVWN